MKPRRSALYMPGANARALEKAKSLAADLLILDLEDAVAPEAKAAARVNIAEAFAGEGYGRKQVALRTNGHATTWFADDLALAADVGVSAVLVPKVGSGPDVAAIRAQMSAARIAPTVELMAMIETPAGVLNVSEIAALAPGDAYPLTCFVIGTNDLVKETRATLDAARTAALYWLSATVTAARAHGIDVLDGVYNAFKDLEGYRAECEQGRMLGMDGKTLIHPAQIDIANEVFAPSPEEIDVAQRQIAAFDAAVAAGQGVAVVDGKIVENLHVASARALIARAEAIAAMGD